MNKTATCTWSRKRNNKKAHGKRPKILLIQMKIHFLIAKNEVKSSRLSKNIILLQTCNHNTENFLSFSFTRCHWRTFTLEKNFNLFFCFYKFCVFFVNLRESFFCVVRKFFISSLIKNVLYLRIISYNKKKNETFLNNLRV